jgi:hypothetical protein
MQSTFPTSLDIDLAIANRSPVQYDLRERCDLTVVEHDGVDISRDSFRLVPSASRTKKDAA